MKKDAVLSIIEDEVESNPFNVNYVQQYTIQAWFKLADNKPAMKVFTCLSFAMGKENSVVTSMSSISIVTGVALQNVSRAIKFLKVEGYVNAVKHMNCYLFSINPEVAWKHTTGSRIKILHGETNVLWAEKNNLSVG